MSRLLRSAVRIYREEGATEVAFTAAKKFTPAPYVRWWFLLADEFSGKDSITHPLSTRLWLYRHGFLSQSDVIYNFDRYRPQAYLNDVQRYIRAQQINGDRGELLDDKLAFHSLLCDYDEYLASLYGVLVNNSIHPAPAGDSAEPNAGVRPVDTIVRNPAEWITRYVRTGDPLVCKPNSGGRGSGVRIYDSDDGEFSINGTTVSERELRTDVRSLDYHLVYEFVEQAEYIEDIYPETANTVRVLTMFDQNKGEAFAAAAVQRMGSDRSTGLDNWSQGGLSAQVDLSTGELGPAVQYPYEGNLVWHDYHPSTGEKINRVKIPGWEQIKKQVVEIAESISFIPYIGWDVLVTDDGEFVILEANRNSDVDLLQVHEPLLTNSRTAQFYADYGVI